jgi:hypothetical protein
MEDDLHYSAKWKTNSIFKVNGKRYALFGKMGDNLKFKVNRRRLQSEGKWKTTSICWLLEDDLHFGKWKTTII